MGRGISPSSSLKLLGGKLLQLIENNIAIIHSQSCMLPPPFLSNSCLCGICNIKTDKGLS